MTSLRPHVSDSVVKLLQCKYCQYISPTDTELFITLTDLEDISGSVVGGDIQKGIPK